MNILIAGDFCPQNRVAKLIEEGKYSLILENVKEAITSADYSIVNFECSVTTGERMAIKKCGPNLHCSERGLGAIKWGGFDCVTLANNHFYDYGEYGVIDTLAACCKFGIDVVGGGLNLQEAAKILYRRIGNEILAIINCCEHEFSIATDKTGGSNPLNPIQQYYSIKDAKTKADYVVVIVHGGHEYYQLPSPRMQETYRFFVDAGADTVVNHHQHCFSGYEIYHGRPIFYGLGNFCFDNSKYRNTKWNEGYMVSLEMDKSVDYKIIPYIQCSNEANVTLLEPSAFSEKIQSLNSIIEDPMKLTDAKNHYYASRSQEYSNILEPFQNRYYKALKRRGWLPSFITMQRKLRQENYICCESHRDILSFYF